MALVQRLSASKARQPQLLSKKRILLAPWQVVLLLSAYIGIVLNCAVFMRRFAELGVAAAVPTASFFATPLLMLLSELALVFSFTALLLSLADLSCKWLTRLLMALLLIISVLASYYMTFFNVVIGYGVVQAVLTTDVDLSKEAVGVGLLLWLFGLAVLPMALWWRYVAVRRNVIAGWAARFKQWAARLGLVVLCAATFAVIAQRVNSDNPEQATATVVGQDIGQASLAAIAPGTAMPIAAKPSRRW